MLILSNKSTNQKILYKKALDEAQLLFDSLMQQYFRIKLIEKEGEFMGKPQEWKIDLDEYIRQGRGDSRTG